MLVKREKITHNSTMLGVITMEGKNNGLAQIN
jgi:hypothetical protein